MAIKRKSSQRFSKSTGKSRRTKKTPIVKKTKRATKRIRRTRRTRRIKKASRARKSRLIHRGGDGDAKKVLKEWKERISKSLDRLRHKFYTRNKVEQNPASIR